MDNHGFIAQPPRDTDYIAGAVESIGSLDNQTGDWSDYLPADELQNGVYFDSMACVTFSALNSLETQVNYLLKASKLPQEAFFYLRDNGYLKDGTPNFSDRFIAKQSGTTPKGNSMVTVWDTVRKSGLIPEKDWTYDPAQRIPPFDWSDYYTAIPQPLVDKAVKFLDTFTVKYEWLVAGGSATPKQYAEWLKAGPIQIATTTCPGWGTGTVNACDLATNHAVLLYKVDEQGFHIFDHYKPFRKVLSSDYRIPYALRGIITPKSAIPQASYDAAFGKKFYGQLLLAVEDAGSLWFVTPDGKRAKIGRKQEEVNSFLRLVNEKKLPIVGISNKDIAKIEPIQ